MPIYEYKCDNCGAERELFVRTVDVAAPACPKCRKKMRRVISPTSFILKGSGWYVTDYPSDARKKGLEREKSPAPAAETAAEKTADKTAAKKDEKTAPAKSEKAAVPAASGERKPSKTAKKRA